MMLNIPQQDQDRPGGFGSFRPLSLGLISFCLSPRRRTTQSYSFENVGCALAYAAQRVVDYGSDFESSIENTVDWGW